MNKRLLSAAIACIWGIFLSSSAASRADDVEGVHRLLDKVEETWERRDSEAYSKLWSDEGALLIADTGLRPEGAFCLTKESWLPGLAQVWERESLSHRFVRRDIQVQNDVAWLWLTIADRLRGRKYSTAHTLAIALRRDDSWRICLSMPLFVEPVAVVTGVLPDSAASRAGIKPGDVLSAYAGRRIQRAAALQHAVDAHAEDGSGAHLAVGVQRRHERHWFHVAPGPLGVRLEDRLLPSDGAVLIEPGHPHPIKDLIEDQILAVRSEDAGRFRNCLCPTGFIALWDMGGQEGKHTVATRANVSEVVSGAFRVGREQFDYGTAKAEGIRLIVMGDVALASWRLELTRPAPEAGRISVPTHLQAYVRQSGKWWLAAELPARIELGTHVDVVARETPQQAQESEIRLRGRLAGLGLGISVEEGHIYITKVFPGSGAAEAGLKAGEIITSIAGRSTQGMTADAFAKLARGAAGSTVTLKVHPPEGRSRTVVVTRKTFRITGVESHILPGDTGLIQITRFNMETAGEVRRVLDAFANQGVTGLVLDLRGNTGGLYGEVVKVADLFIERGKRLWLIRRTGRKPDPVRAQTDAATDKPLIVLIGDKTLSGGELLAAALKQTKRATLVGQTTAGLAALKARVEKPDGSFEIVKRGEFLANARIPITGRGVEPDVVIPANTTSEQWLDEAVRLLRAQLGP